LGIISISLPDDLDFLIKQSTNKSSTETSLLIVTVGTSEGMLQEEQRGSLDHSFSI
jgi:hypothetical protein